MAAEALVGIIVATFILFGTLIGFLSKWIVVSVKKNNDSMLSSLNKEVVINKSDIIAIDDTLDFIHGDKYTEKKQKKKTEIIELYKARGILD